METIALTDLKNYLENYIPAIIDWNNRSLHKTEEELRFEAYTEIVATQALEPLMSEYINELKSILNIVDTLDCNQIQEWCLKTKDLYYDRLFGFDLEYFYFTETSDDPIVLNRLGVTILSNGFENLIQFCKVQGILYWGEYYMHLLERTKPDPNSYYYTPPDPDAPDIITIIKSLLKMI